MLPHDRSFPTKTGSFSGGCHEGGNFRIRGLITRDATLGPGTYLHHPPHSLDQVG